VRIKSPGSFEKSEVDSCYPTGYVRVEPFRSDDEMVRDAKLRLPLRAATLTVWPVFHHQFAKTRQPCPEMKRIGEETLVLCWLSPVISKSPDSALVLQSSSCTDGEDAWASPGDPRPAATTAATTSALRVKGSISHLSWVLAGES
jgi:hypothetical protein